MNQCNETEENAGKGTCNSCNECTNKCNSTRRTLVDDIRTPYLTILFGAPVLVFVVGYLMSVLGLIG